MLLKLPINPTLIGMGHWRGNKHYFKSSLIIHECAYNRAILRPLFNMLYPNLNMHISIRIKIYGEKHWGYSCHLYQYLPIPVHKPHPEKMLIQPFYPDQDGIQTSSGTIRGLKDIVWSVYPTNGTITKLMRHLDSMKNYMLFVLKTLIIALG